MNEHVFIGSDIGQLRARVAALEAQLEQTMNNLDTIEARLRMLAGKFTGSEIGQRLPSDDHGAARTLGITFVNEKGEDVDVGEFLLDTADAIAMLGLPKVAGRS